MIPCLLFEDDHLLVVNKPAGMATHRTGETSPWGLFEFLLNRRPDLHTLGIHQRLDRPTSGVLVFSKSPQAKSSLSRQFEGRSVRKEYVFLTRGSVSRLDFSVSDPIEGKQATTRFQFQRHLPNGLQMWKAIPETGRTHQVRLHAAANGLPIVGENPLEKGIAGDDGKHEPLLLHAARLDLQHPLTEKRVIFESPIPTYFETSEVEHRRIQAAIALRQALMDETETNACRWIHRHADGFPWLTMDRLGEWLYVEEFGSPCDHGSGASFNWHDFLAGAHGYAPPRANAFPPSPPPPPPPRHPGLLGIILSSVSGPGSGREKQLVAGLAPSSEFTILENKVRYRIDLLRPGSTGLFLDQRENRRHLQSLSKGTRILNLFAHTCGFSVAAAVSGPCETVNIDLSRRALEWGRANFQENDLNSASHKFLTEDVFKALAKINRQKDRFDIVLLDPPSSSRSKSSGHFSVKNDYSRLVQLAAAPVKTGGWLFCSTNLASWPETPFFKTVEEGLEKAGRRVIGKSWMPQPFDFPAMPGHPPYLKSFWLRLE